MKEVKRLDKIRPKEQRKYKFNIRTSMIFVSIMLPLLFLGSDAIWMLLQLDPHYNDNHIFGIGVSGLTTKPTRTTKRGLQLTPRSRKVALLSVPNANDPISLFRTSITTAFNAFVRRRDVDGAHAVFTMQVNDFKQESNIEAKPNLYTLNAIIHAYCSKSNKDGMIVTAEKLPTAATEWYSQGDLEEGPNTITFKSFIHCSSKPKQRDAPSRASTRRLATVGILSTFVAGLRPAAAFDNGIPDMALYSKKPKNPGTQPALGLQGNDKLARCDYAPNCFSTSGDESHMLQMWKPKAGSNAMGEIMETIQAYPPGQAKIDKGGFSIITASTDYLYVQFESLKMGFLDDVEFAVTDGEVQVRSSSRIGFLDLGVNAKRLNWISADLRAKGWTAPAITQTDYPDYFPMLTFTYDDYIRSVLSPLDCPVPSAPLTCRGVSLRPPP